MNDKNKQKFNNLKQNRINNQITAKRVFLIDAAGEKIGAVSIFEAMDRANEVSMDLVEVSRSNELPVCKIMDYGKYCFLMNKNKAKAKKEQKTRDKKEIQIRPSIEEHDFQVKLKRLIEFLQDGFKVNVVLKFKGRQIVHPEIGINVLNRFAENAKAYGKVETIPVVEGKRANMMIAPVNSNMKAKKETEQEGELAIE